MIALYHCIVSLYCIIVLNHCIVSLLERGGWQARPRDENFLREERGWLGRSVLCLCVSARNPNFSKKSSGFLAQIRARTRQPDLGSEGRGGTPGPLSTLIFYLSKEPLISDFGPHTGACHRRGGGGNFAGCIGQKLPEGGVPPRPAGRPAGQPAKLFQKK